MANAFSFLAQTDFRAVFKPIFRFADHAIAFLDRRR
jgi:hypothetical protein